MVEAASSSAAAIDVFGWYRVGPCFRGRVLFGAGVHVMHKRVHAVTCRPWLVLGACRLISDRRWNAAAPSFFFPAISRRLACLASTVGWRGIILTCLRWYRSEWINGNNDENILSSALLLCVRLLSRVVNPNRPPPPPLPPFSASLHQASSNVHSLDLYACNWFRCAVTLRWEYKPVRYVLRPQSSDPTGTPTTSLFKVGSNQIAIDYMIQVCTTDMTTE